MRAIPHCCWQLVALALAIGLASPAQAATILCQGSCPVDGSPPVYGAGDLPFDFVLGLAADPGEDLSLVVTGSIYVYGEIDVMAGGSVSLDSGQTVDLEPGTISGPGVVITASASGLPGPSLYEVDGDAYLDVSGASLAGLSLTAGQGIVLDPTDAVVFTPEPGSGLLRGSALALLGTRRARRSRGAAA